MAKQIDPVAVAKEFETFFAKKQADVSAAIDALLEEETEIQTKADERKAQIREQIQPLNDLYTRATGKPYLTDTSSKKGSGKQSKAGKEKPTAAESEQHGKIALKLLKQQKGEWVAWKEIVKAIGSQFVTDALAPYLESGEVVKKEKEHGGKVGKATEYRHPTSL